MRLPLCALLLLSAKHAARAFAPARCAAGGHCRNGERRPRSAALSASSQTDAQDDVASLPLPPNKGFNIFRNLRDSFSYIADPSRFVAKRTKELGQVFVAYQFFKPVVYVGGQQPVRSFVTNTERRSSVIYPGLPETFMELHTKWGSLNMDIEDPLFSQSRELFADVLQSSGAMERFTESIEAEVEAYVAELEERARKNPDETMFLVPELKSLCLQLFSRYFSGEGLTKEQEQMFIDYNDGLLALGSGTNGYKKGKEALDNLKVEMIRRFRALDDPSIPANAPGKFYHDQVFGREGFDDEDRIGTGMVLFVWGAYTECASLMMDAAALMLQKDRKEAGEASMIETVRNELKRRKEESGLSLSDPKFWSGLPYTLGVLRETLRLEPPGAGVPRFSKEDFEFEGYRIPAEMPVMLEPRIGNMEPALFPEPERFEPLRWSPTAAESEASESRCPMRGTALKKGPGSWFPGGFGAHQCPGLPVAELAGKIFVSKLAERFTTWEFSGDGLKKNGEIDFVKIPVKIAPDNFGMKLILAEK
mmetsp:Transcript_57356/g.171056  ORF Transcript_57356/g.171056 Transcript_57356/m.171056 type:complete len:534 (-) Transcript_57356:226-1827(-)